MGCGMQNQSLNSSPTQMSPRVSSVIDTCSPLTDKDWRHVVTSDLRQHLIKRLAVVVSRKMKTIGLKYANDGAIQNARKHEAIMFNKAKTLEEYYYLLADKIIKIQRASVPLRNKISRSLM